MVQLGTWTLLCERAKAAAASDLEGYHTVARLLLTGSWDLVTTQN